jgi:hypothetical protein
MPRSYSDFVDRHIADHPSGATIVRTRCTQCGVRLPQGPWTLPWFALAFCTSACAAAWEGSDDDAPL